MKVDLCVERHVAGLVPWCGALSAVFDCGIAASPWCSPIGRELNLHRVSPHGPVWT